MRRRSSAPAVRGGNGVNRWKRLAPVTAVVASAAMVLSACVGSDAAADRSELAFWMMGEGSEAPKKVQAARAGGEGSGVGLVPASSGWRSHRVHGKAAMAFAGSWQVQG